ncbi:hypothetical protein EJ110_NYTH12040 [Nymphaea thermarum]|nr:hypothetical protein EJ110_NYTH12040 [Nymphaea thermarum]
MFEIMEENEKLALTRILVSINEELVGFVAICDSLNKKTIMVTRDNWAMCLKSLGLAISLHMLNPITKQRK